VLVRHVHATVATMFALSSMPPSAAHISHAHVAMWLHCGTAVRVLTSKNYTTTANKSERYDRK
jgi:hypothetical protein